MSLTSADVKVQWHEEEHIQDLSIVPWKKFSSAAVMKILKTLLKTSGSNNAVSDPEGLHAMMSMAWGKVCNSMTKMHQPVFV